MNRHPHHGCPHCGRPMTWELDCYDGYVCWPCADAEDPEDVAWWDAVLNDEPAVERAS